MRAAGAICLLLATMLLVSPAGAATISITATNAAATGYDLTNTYGTSDWAYWGQTGNPVTAPVAPTNEKAGADLIGAITAYNGTGVRGSTSTTKPVYDFSFTDGAVTASGTVTDLIGLFNRTLGTTGAGVQVNVTAPTADPFTIYVWGTAFGCTGTLTASIDVVSATNSDLVQAGIRSPGKLYAIDVDPDTAGQTVNIRMSVTSPTDITNGNASVSGVAVSVPVPEPSSMAAALAGALGLGLRRRRWEPWLRRSF